MDIINRIISTIISKYGGFFMDLKKSIRIVEDFPKPGISFKDITTLIADGEAFKYSIEDRKSTRLNSSHSK